MTLIDTIVVQPVITVSGLSTEVVRTFESAMMPQVGQKIRDRMFGHSADLIVEDVVIDYATDECYVYLAPVTLDNADRDDLRDHVREYERHGWEWPRPI
ncbi:hypothetical protein SAMN05428987_3094 [Paenibacillus sp. CF095]|uniref:hypothetical protein n=1 Tax=Paenibacillus sp. CF095 TaxID=1881033 RepID=UPI00088D083A|nr:hypothetical protein [Paenibacillus sp. CF095]SDC86574.1 hypothetical protein SAMN05428987_3094 [Paenibacillus sp. CF095]